MNLPLAADIAGWTTFARLWSVPSPAGDTMRTCVPLSLLTLGALFPLALSAAGRFDCAPVSAAPASLEAVAPPQNVEAEESVLGAMLLSATAVGTVTEILDAPHFYRDRHAAIYRAMLALWAKGEPVDAITLSDELDERSELEHVGGRAKIAELAALVPAASNVEHYARIVKEMATLRGLVQAGPLDRATGPGASRRDRGPRRPRRADRLRPRPAAGVERLRAHRGAAQGELRANHPPLRGGGRRSPASRPASGSSTSSRRASSPAT